MEMAKPYRVKSKRRDTRLSFIEAFLVPPGRPSRRPEVRQEVNVASGNHDTFVRKQYVGILLQFSRVETMIFVDSDL